MSLLSRGTARVPQSNLVAAPLAGSCQLDGLGGEFVIACAMGAPRCGIVDRGSGEER